MKLVPQEDALGCAIASVAARLSLPYSSARRLFVADGVNVSGFSRREVISALRLAGFTGVLTRFGRASTSSRLARIPIGAIVCLRRNRADRVLHYVVRQAKCRWLDSLDRGAEKKAKWRASTGGQVRTTWPRGWVPLSFIDVTRN
ncbi:MAG: hypothetical protein JNM17_16150 [Archangium sp.]|nr:hypothetical protein [Archangium sp.]